MAPLTSDLFHTCVEGLAKRHETFSTSSSSERIILAKAILSELAKDRWSVADNWIARSAELERLPDGSTPEGQNIGSINRFVFGSLIKTFLTTFVDSVAPGQRKTPLLNEDTLRHVGRYMVNGPVHLGFAVPGLTFELFSELTRWSENKADEVCYAKRCRPGTVSVVLGAGNQNFMSLISVLERCLVHSECVLLKHHPLRPFLYTPYAILLRPLVESGLVVQVLDADVPEPSQLLVHPLVAHVDLIGSGATYRAICKTIENSDKSSAGCAVRAELGCATPWLVVPGTWTAAEIEQGASLIAVSKKANGGCNCLSAQVVVVPSRWAQKATFLKALERRIADVRTCPVYYPGSSERAERIADQYKGRARRIKSINRMPGTKATDDVLWVDCGTVHAAVVGDVHHTSRQFDEFVLTTEAFGPVIAIVEMDMTDNEPADVYMSRCCAWANSQSLYGSLSCTVLSPESVNNEVVDHIIAKLEYGSIAVNTWSLFGYTCAMLGGTWGAHPDDDSEQSGRGYIGNAYGMRGVVKTAVRARSLGKVGIDLSTPPSTFLVDLVHTLTIGHSNIFAVCGRVLLFAAGRLGNIFWVPSGRKYGAVC